MKSNVFDSNYHKTLDLVPRCRFKLNRDDEHDSYRRNEYVKVLRSGIACTPEEDDFCDSTHDELDIIDAMNMEPIESKDQHVKINLLAQGERQ